MAAWIHSRDTTIRRSSTKAKDEIASIGYGIAYLTMDAEGTVTYHKDKGPAKIRIAKKTGNVTVKKGLKKGTYKVRVTMNASGNDYYEPGSKTKTFRVRVQ